MGSNSVVGVFLLFFLKPASVSVLILDRARPCIVLNSPVVCRYDSGSGAHCFCASTDIRPRRRPSFPRSLHGRGAVTSAIHLPDGTSRNGEVDVKVIECVAAL